MEISLNSKWKMQQCKSADKPRQWHRVTLTFDGPQTDEKAVPNPFLDYRLQVTFRQADRVYVIPGFFAADGNAAETGTDSGNKWRVHFCPDTVGSWAYTVSFRQGKEMAVSDDREAGTSVSPLDGLCGVVEIAPSNKTERNHRAKGRLQYVGKRYLRFAGTGEYFLKQGADAPENFLAYADFDGNFKSDGHKDELVKTWKAHVRDWQEGAPTWQKGKGKGIIGAVNYLAEGATLDLSELKTPSLSIRANTSAPDVGNVRFGLNDNDNYRLERVPPYALTGDRSGDYAGWTPSVGKHTMTATVDGKTLTLTFKVVK